MGIQKIKSTQICPDSINGTEIKDGSITGDDLAFNTIEGSHIALNTIVGANIKNATITGSNIVNATLTGAKIANATITGINIAATTIDGNHIKSAVISNNHIIGGTIINSSISETAAIDTAKINWNSWDQSTALSAIRWAEGIYAQSYDLEDCTSNSSLTGNMTTAHIFPLHINWPLVANYFTYILTSGKSGQKVKVAVFNSNGIKFWESSDQTGTSGTFKIPMNGQKLIPGVYYIMFLANNASPKFLMPAAVTYAVLPQRGTYTISSWIIPATLNFANISQSTARQPWCCISKY